MTALPTNVVLRTPLLSSVLTKATDLTTGWGIHVYLTRAGHKPDGTVETVPAIAGDRLQRVQRYVVITPFGGNETAEQALDSSRQVDVDWGFQVTCAAGFPRDALAVAGLVDATFYLWRLDVEGLQSGRLRPPEGYSPGPEQVDTDVSPHRFWLPMQYGTTITAT